MTDYELIGNNRMQKNRQGKTCRFFWCTRWGSNPDSTASEAVMLSNYTTSTYSFFSFFKKHLYFTIFCFHFASVYGIIFANC